MEQAPTYTDAEKIQKFDEIQAEALAQHNWDERELGENDEHYFWEAVIEITLGIE